MIFKKLYNWAKYKTLPPSILFKNRLYIERDSKTRRITSNLGLTFRNSKWSNYARTDINLNLKENWVKSVLLIISILLFFIFICYLGSNYIPEPLSNELYYAYFYIKDLIIYLNFMLGVIIIGIISRLIEQFYKLSFLSLFVKKEEESSSKSSLTWTLPIIVHKNLYYNWLIKTNTDWSKQNVKLFSINFFNYKPMSEFKNNFSNNYNLDKFSWNLPDKNLYPTYSEFPGLVENYFLKQLASQNEEYLNEQINSSLFWINKRFSWNLSNIIELLNNKNKENLNTSFNYYLQNINFMQFNNFFKTSSNLVIFNDILENQLSTIKSQKFLYNYSILHRKSIKDAHKLTMVKTLLTSGFYDSTLLENNLWASDFFNKVSKPHDLIESELKLLYKNFFNESYSFNYLLGNEVNNKTLIKLNLLSFYETSYFWFLKRFYLFNNLNTNNFKFTLDSQIKSSIDQEVNLNNYLFQSNLILKSNLLLNYNLSDLSSYLSDTTNLMSKSNIFLKDILILRQENDLLTLDNESLISDLYLTLAQNKVWYYFKFYKNTNINDFDLKPLSRTNKNSLKSNLITPLTSDISFFKDLKLLFKFL